MFVGTASLDHSKGECEEALLEKAFTYYTNDGHKIIVKSGWLTDGASFTIRALGCPYKGCYVMPSILHDILYKSQVVSRKRADDIFSEANNHMGVNVLVRAKLYSGVRMFGGYAWNGNKEDAEQYKKYIEIIKPNE